MGIIARRSAMRVNERRKSNRCLGHGSSLRQSGGPSGSTEWKQTTKTRFKKSSARKREDSVLKQSSNAGMTFDEYVAAIRKIAVNDGIVAHESYWYPQVWRSLFENGLTPLEAWDHERNPALYAM